MLFIGVMVQFDDLLDKSLTPVNSLVIETLRKIKIQDLNKVQDPQQGTGPYRTSTRYRTSTNYRTLNKIQEPQQGT